VAVFVAEPTALPPAHLAPGELACGLAHLRCGAEFQAAMGRRARVTKTPHFAAHVSHADHVFVPTAERPRAAVPRVANAAPARAFVGVVVPKRWARRAVTRNGIKREIYALARSWAAHHWPAEAVLVVRLHRAFDRAQFRSAWSMPLAGAVRSELHTLMQRALTPAATVVAAPTSA
jgi:ribonuclease P protein component